MSSTCAAASSDFIVKLTADDMGLTSLLSSMPRWARLRFPEPSVSMAGLRFTVPPAVSEAAVSGPMTSSPPCVDGVSCSFLACWVAFCFDPGLLVMVSVILLAAFCAAEKMEAKKPPDPLGDWGTTAVPPGVLDSSG